MPDEDYEPIDYSKLICFLSTMNPNGPHRCIGVECNMWQQRPNKDFKGCILVSMINMLGYAMRYFGVNEKDFFYRSKKDYGGARPKTPPNYKVGSPKSESNAGGDNYV